MKKQYVISVFVNLTFAIFFMSCSELKNSLPTATPAVLSVHGPGWADTASSNFHGNYIQAMYWDIRPCQQCHGSKYTGGTSGETCQNQGCHSKPGGPENCSTCHGLPPGPDVYGNTSTSTKGVGAHQIHSIGTGSVSFVQMRCEGCHQMPNGVYGQGHIDSTGHANVIISDPLANLVTNGVSPNPTYDPNTLKCSNTFCHGKWTLPKSGLASDSVFSGTTMSGANYSPTWNGGHAQAGCGNTCHLSPPTGHNSYSQNCSVCHEDVTTSAGKLKHMNGKIEVYGSVRNFR